MAQLPPARREPGLRLRPAESIPLTKVRDGAEALLTMEVSDDLMPIGLHAGEKPELPADSDELVAYYEKQLAATQLVQHRLQKQFDQLTEEKVALETSLSVQTAALQQQLVLAREKAERAMAQAEQAQEKVQSAHAAVGEIVGAVTQLAELLDVAGASNELTHSFEAVAHSTQRTFQAVTAAQEGAQAVLVMQLEARDACQVSPLLTAVSLGEPRTTDAMKRLEEESIRLRTELEEANNREQELEAEMHAAQLLFTGLEAEVVSLQHDQAQAAAKLQVSQEELVAARDQLLEVRDVLSAVGSPEANVLNQGLVKLDAHLSTIRSFIDGLSMPQPAAVVNVSGSNTLQRQVGRSADGSTTRNAELHDGHHGISSVQMMRIVAERDRLRNRVIELELHVAGMEAAQESLVREHTRQVSMAAAAGAAGAAAAVAVASDAAASTATPSPVRSPSAVGAAASIFTADSPVETKDSRAGGLSAMVLATLEPLDQHAAVTEAAFTRMAAERDAAVERALCFEEEVQALRELLHHCAGDRDIGLHQLAHRLGEAGPHFPDVKGAAITRLDIPLVAAKRVAATEVATDPARRSDAGQSASALEEFSPSPLGMPPPASHTRSRLPGTSDMSGSVVVDEANDLFLDHGEPLLGMARACTRSSAGVHSSYQSFTSEAPLAPQRRYTDASERHTYPLDPTETLEELLHPTGVAGATLSLSAGDGSVECAQQHTISDGLDTTSLVAEVQQLQAALCGLLVSKAIACAELRSEFDARLAALQEQHEAALAKLQSAQRQPSCNGAPNSASPSVPGHAAVECSDKSILLSEDDAAGGLNTADLLQHTVFLEVRIVELQQRQQQLASSYEERLLQLQADYEARLAAMLYWEQQEAEAMEAERQAASSELSALHQAVEQLQQQCNDMENRAAAFRKQHEAELLAHGAELGAQHTKHCTNLQTGKASELVQLSGRHEEGVSGQAAHDEGLARLGLAAQKPEELDLAMHQAPDLDVAGLQSLVLELREQLAQEQAERQVAMEELKRNLKDREGDLMLRESLISELQGQLLQLQNEKELEEQSLQSLLSTKAWMTEEIRSLQASLKEATAKLASVEIDVTGTRSGGVGAAPAHGSCRLTDAVAEAPWSSDIDPAIDFVAQRHTLASGGARIDREMQARPSRSLAGASLPTAAGELEANAVIALAADQLAEASMQAAVAEAQLENLQLRRRANDMTAGCSYGGFPALSQTPRGATGPTFEETSLMMETVVLQGELDELREKHRMLQSQLAAFADELAHAIMCASLAELQLEELPIPCSISRAEEQSTGEQTPQPAVRVTAVHAHGGVRSAAMAEFRASPGLVATTPTKPDELLFCADVLDLFGTDVFVPIQQARQLYRELRAVQKALGALMVNDAVANNAKSREAYSSVWEAVLAAQDKAANVVLALQQQQHHRKQKPDEKPGGQGLRVTFLGEEQPVDESQEGTCAAGWDQPEVTRAREGYREACEVYEMLRSDAEDINSQLWRWNVRLHQQLSTKEQELTRAQIGIVPGAQLALEALLNKKEAYVRSIESQVSELQTGLQAAHARLLQRDSQLAALQDMLLQLSEELAVFESVVVRCEMLSAGLVSKSAARRLVA